MRLLTHLLALGCMGFSAWKSVSLMERNTYVLREVHLRDLVDLAISKLRNLDYNVVINIKRGILDCGW